MKNQKSPGQQAALERFPEATRHFGDFSMAQGYAECYRERVEPLVKALREALDEFHKEDRSYPDRIGKELERYR